MANEYATPTELKEFDYEFGALLPSPENPKSTRRPWVFCMSCSVDLAFRGARRAGDDDDDDSCLFDPRWALTHGCKPSSSTLAGPVQLHGRSRVPRPVAGHEDLFLNRTQVSRSDLLNRISLNRIRIGFGFNRIS